MRDRIIPFRTENQADWRVLIRMRPVLASVVQVKVHLARISMRESAEL